MQNKLLFISCQGIGNTILCLPIIQSFKEKGYSCDWIVSDNGSSEIVKIFGLADQIYEWQERKNHFQNLVAIGAALKNKTYEKAYALVPSGRRENLILRMAHAQSKGGWRTKHFIRLLSSLDPKQPLWDEGIHDLESNQMLTRVTSGEIEKAIQSIRWDIEKRFPQSRKKGAGPLSVGCQPFTKEISKSWTESQYQYFFNELSQRAPIQLRIFGSKNDERRTKELEKNIKIKIDWFIDKKWEEILPALKEADVFIGIDSCLAHLAGLMGIPACVFYGFTSPTRTGVVGEQTLMISSADSGTYRFLKGYPKNQKVFPLPMEEALKIVSLFLKRDHRALESQYDSQRALFGAKSISIVSKSQ